ncbi:chemotaxis response regulator protein-glutamate methylesterase [Fulvimarina endophytica]|uniref:Protein-glutamate methylesterase/protein-glutamine glutaminase n=1 Tax=Fulvimarina endophytica TaxID=2293836 RepID=A0A371X853_9HYPH|nr:chemotaxis response regulator protein-glutamate methylesterase [Fulvimarina endophytica]RFC65371.1 chemotaxis response regulator protein-glutamate methylesterase [Fulvimarina endophytica]
MTAARVLIVDDSAVMRALVRNTLSNDDSIEIVGEATNVAEARQKIKEIEPDVLTLDVEMPGMNGLEFLEKIMRLRPMPVVMVSSLTRPGADAALRAFEIGAFDCVAKPNGSLGGNFSTLPSIVKQAAAAKARIGLRVERAGAPASVQPAAMERKADWPQIVAIGASTGGVEALIAFLSNYPKNCPPTVIVQHMPGLFTTSFAARLDRACAARVAEAEDGEPLMEGRVYLARGGRHLRVRTGAQPRCVVRGEEVNQGHCPSVDTLFHSVAENYGAGATGVLLTGMGRDGAEGLLAIRREGGRTFAQDKGTALVYGMPRVAHEIGAVDRGTPLHAIAREVFA